MYCIVKINKNKLWTKNWRKNPSKEKK